MDNKYSDYLRLPRLHEFNILRSICVHPQSKIIYFTLKKNEYNFHFYALAF